MENEKIGQGKFDYKMHIQLLAYLFKHSLENSLLTHTDLQEFFNKSKVRISQMLKHFKQHELIDIIHIHTWESEKSKEKYILNEKGKKIALSLVREWFSEELHPVIEKILNEKEVRKCSFREGGVISDE